ncbi:hypothetical protein BP00DRAFT_425751 [Aspergillus indologenus CBS 114.80]|uniref:Uncharacterized protein n=1 Tax=Aspergillus indologenus CBS 114.80 TaxID=1450541 RepID=A0A2V5IAL8_9EURO|nr:hypothetical protein BP00DRAFT_425751 [Aspergillus indologenus CBS 114.80]
MLTGLSLCTFQLLSHFLCGEKEGDENQGKFSRSSGWEDQPVTGLLEELSSGSDPLIINTIQSLRVNECCLLQLLLASLITDERREDRY